ncbi:lasso RiPP family leader peptide-containing protein [Pengzhenrongella sicca]|uniref:Lasso RiPP family leader peptide-containing protein n=1 Tax=Pengzhenrongella sicca TaxID=2819238 RepID=A0A8A4ZAI2_9MICO|nr:lasso RiPP family leader peptide-containing protein [Pengzhenrongella sicca]
MRRLEESAGSGHEYEPPRIARLGSLAELTRGLDGGGDDGLGGGAFS